MESLDIKIRPSPDLDYFYLKLEQNSKDQQASTYNRVAEFESEINSLNSKIRELKNSHEEM